MCYMTTDMGPGLHPPVFTWSHGLNPGPRVIVFKSTTSDCQSKLKPIMFHPSSLNIYQVSFKNVSCVSMIFYQDLQQIKKMPSADWNVVCLKMTHSVHCSQCWDHNKWYITLPVFSICEIAADGECECVLCLV